MILDGKQVAKEIVDELKQKIENIKDEINLAVVVVGDNKSSKSYINGVIRTSKNIGVNVKLIELDENVSTEKMVDKIIELNNNNDISGIMLQMPLPKGIDTEKIIESIDGDKDVDGLTQVSLGKVVKDDELGFIPCTPLAILKIIEFYKIDLNGMDVVVLGRSNIVGKPIATLLTNRNATVTICHSRTKNLKEKTKAAELLIVAIGRKHFITKDMVNDDAIVIDVGINVENGKLFGDVDFDSMIDKVKLITPVPGGVGAVTNSLLISNTIDGYINSKK